MNQNQNKNKKAYVFVPEHFAITAKKEILTDVGMLLVEKKFVKEGTDEHGLDIYVEVDYEVPGGYLLEA